MFKMQSAHPFCDLNAALYSGPALCLVGDIACAIASDDPGHLQLGGRIADSCTQAGLHMLPTSMVVTLCCMTVQQVQANTPQ